MLASVGTLAIILLHPLIQISLQLFQGVVKLLAKSHRIKLILNGAMETLADTIGLRMARFGLGMVDILNRQVQLILVMLQRAAVFCASISQDAQQRDFLLLKEGEHPALIRSAATSAFLRS